MLVRRVSILLGLWSIVAGCGNARPSVPDAAPDQTCVVHEEFQAHVNRKLDLLFVVDDSPAMANMEAKLARELPAFMPALVDATTNKFDNLHVGIVSSSLGGGRFTDVPGCEAGGAGDRGGRLSHPADAGLAAGETFMRLNGVPLNFQGDAGTVFSRLAQVGHAGCPYPQPLEAARRALTKAHDPTDPDNGGFLRDDAQLAVVIISNGDDCSVPASSDLFDPGQTRFADPYGATGPYRCAEFGWLCGGAPPPHQLPGGVEQLALDMCEPAGASGKLTPVAEFSAFLKGLKVNPDYVLVSVIAGPKDPVLVARTTDDGAPALAASCMTALGGEMATPAIRLAAFADTFDANGIRYPTCANFLAGALGGVAERIHVKFGTSCLVRAPTLTSAGLPNCRVTEVNRDENDVVTRWDLSACDADRSILPCWTVDTTATYCLQGVPFRVCLDEACSPPRAYGGGDVAFDISCQVACGQGL